MRKKLGTRFPASRIKKIMQADEDVGKIALAVPLLVSKALELFLQDLCDKTYEVTLQRGAKTMNSLHLKQCVKSYSAFDFLSDVVSKIPSLGGPDAFGDQKFTRRRKTLSDDAIMENDDDRKCARMAAGDVNIGHRGRGRSRGRGRGRPPGRAAERVAEYEKYEDDISMSPEHDQPSKESCGANANLPAAGSTDGTNPSEKTSAEVAVASAPTTELENLMGWAYPETGSIGIEPRNLVNLTVTIDQDEDYDNEE